MCCSISQLILISKNVFRWDKILFKNGSTGLQRIYLWARWYKQVSPLPSISYQSDSPTPIAQGDLNTHTRTRTRLQRAYYYSCDSHSLETRKRKHRFSHFARLLPTPSARTASTNRLHAWPSFITVVSVLGYLTVDGRSTWRFSTLILMRTEREMMMKSDSTYTRRCTFWTWMCCTDCSRRGFQ